MVVTRNFRVNIGQRFPLDMHKEAVELIERLEGTQFKASSKGLVRGDIQHANIKLVHPSPQDTPPFSFDVLITFFDVTEEEDPLLPGPDGDPPEVGKGNTDFKKRPLAPYPTNGQLKVRGEERGPP